MNKALRFPSETTDPVSIHTSDSDPLVRQLSAGGTVVSVVLITFLALGALVATPVFGLVFGIMTLGLIGLGWVML